MSLVPYVVLRLDMVLSVLTVHLKNLCNFQGKNDIVPNMQLFFKDRCVLPNSVSIHNTHCTSSDSDFFLQNVGAPILVLKVEVICA